MLGNVLELARALIARPSVTPDDAGCLDLLAEWLTPLGFTCERIDRGSVRNLWARRGSAAPLFCFAGHVDVVPPGPREQWLSDPFTASERDGKLYGRGAADMKSSIAAFVVACQRLLAAGNEPAGSIALLITSDEEGDAIDGTVRVCETLAARGERIDYCLVGEPTSVERLGDTIKNGRRGSLSLRLTVKGVQGHVAYPKKVKNPIHLAAPLIAELAATRWDEGDVHFPPTSFQVSNIHAGTGAGNVVPGQCVIDANFRFGTASTAESLIARVGEMLVRHAVDHEIVWTLGARPFLTPPGPLSTALSTAIAKVSPVSTALSTSGGTSDGRFIAEICPQVVEFGPCNDSIHKVDEHVRIAELEPLAEIYRQTMQALLS